MKELTPEQDAALDKFADVIVNSTKAIHELAVTLQEIQKVDAPDIGMLIHELAKKILARPDLPDDMRMPLPIMEQYLHQTFHARINADEATEGLK